MRARLPLILICFTVLFALVGAGCGDDASTSDSAAPAGATQSTEAGATGGTGATGASLEAAYNACLKAAEAIPDSSNSRNATQECKKAYNNVDNATDKVQKNVEDAYKDCQKAANSIDNADAKAQALAACENLN